MAKKAPQPAEQVEKKKRVRRVITALERRFGVPEVKRSVDLIGSFVLTTLSQHTSDRNAERAFGVLKQRFPEWKDVAEASPRAIAAAIRSAGLSNQKSTRIRDFMRWIKAEFGDYDLSPLRQLPTEEITERLTTVKGIGIKTVSVVLLFSLGRDVFPVDTHVHRICRRVGLVADKATAEQTHHRMAVLIPAGKSMSLHVNLLRLGRTICDARGPRCPECPLRRQCAYAATEYAKQPGGRRPS
jgi:endonuclease-3